MNGSRPDDPEPRPPARIDARIKNVTLRTPLEPLRAYLQSSGQPLEGLTRLELDERGYVFAVRVSLAGSVGKKFPLRWSLHRASTRRQLPGLIYSDSPVTFVPRGREHARTWPIWVPSPPRKGSYFLRAALTDEKRQPVDERDSADFVVAEGPRPP